MMLERLMLWKFNRMLRRAGKPTLRCLPLGVRHDGINCVMARALQMLDPTAQVGLNSMAIDGRYARIVKREFSWVCYRRGSSTLSGSKGNVRIEMSPLVYLFRVLFDAGCYPHLVESEVADRCGDDLLPSSPAAKDKDTASLTTHAIEFDVELAELLADGTLAEAEPVELGPHDGNPVDEGPDDEAAPAAELVVI